MTIGQGNISLRTEDVAWGIGLCESREELRERILPILKSENQRWAKKITEIINQTGLSQEQFAKACGVSRQTVNYWKQGHSIPGRRENYMKIAMAAGYTIEETNELLQYYGRYPALYAKTLEDSVCSYVLNQKFGSEAVEKYDTILEKIRGNFEKEGNLAIIESTEKVDAKLALVQSEDELERVVQQYTGNFAGEYRKFYSYVKRFLEVNHPGGCENLAQLAEWQKWSSSLKQSVSAIRQGKWFPTRDKIISLGLHLAMTREDIDEMLRLAHMAPLYAKNPLESIVCFVVEDASLNDVLDPESDAYDPDALCVAMREILEELKLPDLEYFLAELPEMEYEEES